MRNILSNLALMIAFLVISSGAEAETNMLDVTVTFRERIALPPDAHLDVQLLDISREGAGTQRIASQHFAMTSVPMTVGLNFDSRLIKDSNTYVVTATIWSGNQRLFHTDSPQAVLRGTEPNAVEIMLGMIAENPEVGAIPRTIKGIEWAVTEVFGTPWSNDDPATLVIDPEANVSAFGGCNRFRGQALLSDGSLFFSANFAGTMMACPDPVEDRERRFLNALAQVAGYVRYGAGLVMTDAKGNAILHFMERPE